MIKKLVTIGLITVAVAMIAIVLIGLFTKHNGRFGWESIVDAWEGRTARTQTTVTTTENTNNTVSNSTNTVQNTTPATTPVPTTTSPKTTAKTNTIVTPTPTQNTTNNTVTVPDPVTNPNPTPTCKAGGSCTAAQVATHNSPSDCWVIYGNKVYNVTAYIPDHNGGTAVFTTSVCGHDITLYMQGAASSAGRRHTHSSTAYTILNSYWYANLV